MGDVSIVNLVGWDKVISRTLIGYRIGMKYSQSNQAVERGKRRQAAPAVVMVFLILVVQSLLVGFLLI